MDERAYYKKGGKKGKKKYGDLPGIDLYEVEGNFVDSSIRTEVQLFPNNFGLVRKTYTLPASEEATDLLIKEFPAIPVHGSFWIELDSGNILFDYKLDVVKTVTKETKNKDYSSIIEVLQNNLNKPITLKCNNLYYNAKNESDSPIYYLKCEILSATNEFVVVKTTEEIRAIKSASVVGFNGTNLDYYGKVESQTEKSEESVRINYAGKGGTFSIVYLVRAAMYDISYNVEINPEKNEYILSNKMTVHTLSKGLDIVHSLKIMGDLSMETKYDEFLFKAKNNKKPQVTYGKDKVDLTKLVKPGQNEISLAKLFYEIIEISLPQGEKQAVTLLESLKGKYLNMYLLNSKDNHDGKVVCYHSLKMLNDSEFSLMKGNVLLTDSNGLYVSQTYLEETSKGKYGYLKLYQSFVIDCKMTTSVDKNSHEAQDHKIQMHTVMFTFSNRAKYASALRMQHPFKGTMIQSSIEPTEKTSFLIMNNLNLDNNLVFELEIPALGSLELIIKYEVATRIKNDDSYQVRDYGCYGEANYDEGEE